MSGSVRARDRGARYGQGVKTAQGSGRQSPTASDVAKLAGVSQSTVSYVMSGKRTISEATRLRVQAAIDELTYEPNAGARALAGRRSSVIGLVLHFDESTDMAGALPFVETITAGARARDYDVVLVTGADGAAEMERLAKRAVVDAFVIMDIRRDDARLDAAAALGVPVVLIGVPDDLRGLDAFDYDVTHAGELAVAELARDGAERIILLGEAPEVADAGFRFISDFERSVEAAAERHGVPFELLRPMSHDLAGFRGVANGLIGSELRIGVIARTPRVAGWVIHHAMEHGLRPGADLGVVAICTDSAAGSFGMAVTNVSPEPEQVSAAALERLLALLDDVDRSDTTAAALLIEPHLTRRETTRA